jgi:NAD(P)-dependent dehydrogenase (short-subunit alcohol dehydrogenase family)
MSLKGKTLFITGASCGIGLAIALRAARDGANIAIAAKTETPHDLENRRLSIESTSPQSGRLKNESDPSS